MRRPTHWEPGLHLFEVIATEGSGRGLYWVGVEELESPVGHAVRLAAAFAHPFCGGLSFPATAAEVRRTASAGSMDAVLDMVPGRFDIGYELVRDAGDGRVAADCRWTARIAWQPKRGFSWTEERTACATATEPRHIEIAPDGSIAVIPFPGPP